MQKINHIHYNSAHASLISAVTGLARAAEGNRNRPDDAAHRALLDAVRLAGDPQPDTQALTAAIAALHAAKARLIPRCAVCTKPCGRNDNYDWNAFTEQAPALQILKLDLLASLLALAIRLAVCHDKTGFEACLEFLYCGFFEWGRTNRPEILNELQHKARILKIALDLNEGK